MTDRRKMYELISATITNLSFLLTNTVWVGQWVQVCKQTEPLAHILLLLASCKCHKMIDC